MGKYPGTYAGPDFAMFVKMNVDDNLANQSTVVVLVLVQVKLVSRMSRRDLDAAKATVDPSLLYHTNRSQKKIDDEASASTRPAKRRRTAKESSETESRSKKSSSTTTTTETGPKIIEGRRADHDLFLNELKSVPVIRLVVVGKTSGVKCEVGKVIHNRLGSAYPEDVMIVIGQNEMEDFLGEKLSVEIGRLLGRDDNEEVDKKEVWYEREEEEKDWDGQVI